MARHCSYKHRCGHRHHCSSKCHPQRTRKTSSAVTNSRARQKRPQYKDFDTQNTHKLKVGEKWKANQKPIRIQTSPELLAEHGKAEPKPKRQMKEGVNYKNYVPSGPLGLMKKLAKMGKLNPLARNQLRKCEKAARTKKRTKKVEKEVTACILGLD